MFCEMEGFMNGQQFKRLYEKKYEPLMKKYDLRKIELDVLYFLNSYKRYDTAKDIVNYKCLSKAHVSKAIENLTTRNYIAACSDKSDRRCVRLSVTDQALPVLDDMEQLWEKLAACIYEGISSDEHEVFRAVWNKIAGNINSILEEE